MNHADRARELFSCGCNCAQAVVGAYAEEIGLTREQAMRLASSFGGGMGGMRETCGAVTGMFMVLGLARGYDTPGDDAAKKAHYARVRALGEAFREKEGTIICRELLGLGRTGNEEAKPSERTGEYYKKRPCPKIVAEAASIVARKIIALQDPEGRDTHQDRG